MDLHLHRVHFLVKCLIICSEWRINTLQRGRHFDRAVQRVIEQYCFMLSKVMLHCLGPILCLLCGAAELMCMLGV